MQQAVELEDYMKAREMKKEMAALKAKVRGRDLSLCL